MQPTPPSPASAHWCWTWVSGLLLCWQWQLGMYSVGSFRVLSFSLSFSLFLSFFLYFFPPSYVALWDSKTPHKQACEGVSYCLETSPPSRLPPQDRSLSLTLFCLFLSILPYLLLKRMGCLSGCLVSSASVQKLFCGNYSALKFDVFVGEKVVSLSYSPPSWDRPDTFVFKIQDLLLPSG